MLTKMKVMGCREQRLEYFSFRSLMAGRAGPAGCPPGHTVEGMLEGSSLGQERGLALGL